MNAHLAPHAAIVTVTAATGRFGSMCATAGMAVRVSPLQLADRILSLAEAADRAGHPTTATQLLSVMYAVLDRPH